MIKIVTVSQVFYWRNVPIQLWHDVVASGIITNTLAKIKIHTVLQDGAETFFSSQVGMVREWFNPDTLMLVFCNGESFHRSRGFAAHLVSPLTHSSSGGCRVGQASSMREKDPGCTPKTTITPYFIHTKGCGLQTKVCDYELQGCQKLDTLF